MKVTRRFSVDTPITDNGSVLDYARISGIGYYHGSIDQYDADTDVSFDVEQVLLHNGGGSNDVTSLYNISQRLMDSWSDQCAKAVTAHMEYLFSDEIHDELRTQATPAEEHDREEWKNATRYND